MSALRMVYSFLGLKTSDHTEEALWPPDEPELPEPDSIEVQSSELRVTPEIVGLTASMLANRMADVFAREFLAALERRVEERKMIDALEIAIRQNARQAVTK